MKKYSSATVWIIAIILLFFAASFLLNGESSSDRIVFSEFQKKWINDEIESVRVILIRCSLLDRQKIKRILLFMHQIQ